MSVGELVRYASFPWEKMFGRVDPLDLVLAHQLRAYIKFDTSLYAALTKSWIGVALEKKRNSTDRHKPIWFGQRPPPLHDWCDPVWEHDIRLLALDDSSIAEIQSTGECAISVFKCGGLKAVVKATTEITAEAPVSDGQMFWFENVPFAECFLVERSWMLEYEKPREMFSKIEPPEKHAVQVRIGRDSLYFEKAQLECIGRKDSDYPPEDGKTRPLAIIWLYKVSVALNSGLIRTRVIDGQKKMTQGYLEIEKWLEDNAPERVVKGALKKTARTIASKDYNRSKNFDEQGLAKFPSIEYMPKDNLSLPVRFTLSITEWWIGLSKQRQSRTELLCELRDAGFDKTAALDLVGMISGKPVPRDERDQYWKRAQDALKRRKLKRYEEGKSRKILRKSSASDQLDHVVIDCATTG